jgi:adenylate cyclase
MQKALGELNVQLSSDPAWSDIVTSDAPLTAGIGINTGPCVVGNFGSRHRFDYSAIGDTVNLASRLEGASKRYDCAALVTRSTHVRTSGFAMRSLGQIQVRGRAEPIEAFALLQTGARRRVAPGEQQKSLVIA